jgi:hypothetical protein
MRPNDVANFEESFTARDSNLQPIRTLRHPLSITGSKQKSAGFELAETGCLY